MIISAIDVQYFDFIFDLQKLIVLLLSLEGGSLCSVKITFQVIMEKSFVFPDIVFYILVPVQQNSVKVKVLAFQLQLWPNAPAGEVNDDKLWIVLDIANDTVLHLPQFGWVGPHCQLLAGQKNIYMYQCYYSHLFF